SYHAVGLRGCCDDGTAGAHAEAVHSATVLRVINQLVIRSCQFWMAGVFAKPGLSNLRLGMLDPKSYGERCWYDKHAALMQHTEGIAGTVAKGKDDVAAAQYFAVGKDHASHAAIFYQDVRYFFIKAHLSTESFDFFPHGGNNAG